MKNQETVSKESESSVSFWWGNRRVKEADRASQRYFKKSFDKLSKSEIREIKEQFPNLPAVRYRY